MPDTTKKYVTAVGFVQFDPQERDANGKQVLDLVIKTPGGDGRQLRITVWPELILSEPILKGDFLAVDGAFSSSTYQDKEGKQRTSLQISAYSLNVNGKRIERQDREIVTSDADGEGENDTF